MLFCMLLSGRRSARWIVSSCWVVWDTSRRCQLLDCSESKYFPLHMTLSYKESSTNDISVVRNCTRLEREHLRSAAWSSAVLSTRSTVTLEQSLPQASQDERSKPSQAGRTQRSIGSHESEKEENASHTVQGCRQISVKPASRRGG